VARLGLEGGQVAVLRLYAAVSSLRNDCTILAELGERITQLQYLLQLSVRTSENASSTKFVLTIGPAPSAIHLSAWNGDSPKFAITEFYEVRIVPVQPP
jgi:hypothetical protein